MGLSTRAISQVLGAPIEAVEANWPLILAALDREQINTPMVQVAAAATIGTEVPAFKPIHELGGPDYFRKTYWERQQVRHNLGNLTPEDAVNYHGRGFIQLTGRDNYDIYGSLLGKDLIGDPNLALNPAVAADIFALFFVRAHVADAAKLRDWPRVRMRVNGGLNGWTRFSSLVTGLLNVVAEATPAPGTPVVPTSADGGAHA